MIIHNFATFRHHFSEYVSETVVANVDFLNSNPDVIQRTDAVSFIAQGYEPNMRVQVVGAANPANNGFHYPTVVTATDLVVPNSALTPEAGATITFEAVHVDVEGIETWPILLVKTVAGFGLAGSTLTGIPKPLTTVIAITVTCNAGAADAALGVDEYDWYLSQRTDQLASQPLLMVQVPDSGGQSFSGSVQIDINPTLGYLPSGQLNSEDLIAIFKHCHLYVQRRADKAIQWVDLLKEMVANYP